MVTGESEPADAADADRLEIREGYADGIVRLTCADGGPRKRLEVRLLVRAIGATLLAVGGTFCLSLIVDFMGTMRWLNQQPLPQPRPDAYLLGLGLVVFGFAFILVLAGAALAYGGQRLLVDRRRGFLVVRTMLVLPWRRTHVLKEFDRVTIGPVPNSRGLVEMRLRSDSSPQAVASLGRWDSDRADEVARKIADLLSIEVTRNSGLPALRRDLHRQLGCLGAAAAFLALLAVGFIVNITVPFIRDVSQWNKYRPELLVTGPCEILSMKVHAPPPDTRKHGGPRITAGWTVSVRFRYEYAGRAYVSEKYSPVGNSAERPMEALPPGSTSTCYLNPRWPAEAVLTTGVAPESLVYPVAVPAAMVFMLGAMGVVGLAIRRRLRVVRRRETSSRERNV